MTRRKVKEASSSTSSGMIRSTFGLFQLPPAKLQRRLSTLSLGVPLGAARINNSSPTSAQKVSPLWSTSTTTSTRSPVLTASAFIPLPLVLPLRPCGTVSPWVDPIWLPRSGPAERLASPGCFLTLLALLCKPCTNQKNASVLALP